jgi:hypothetical protein
VIRWVYEEEHGATLGRPPVDSSFYADDGKVSGENPEQVQKYVNRYTEGFARVGMKMNPEKTKAMIMDGGKIAPAHSVHAYKRWMEGTGASYYERQNQKVKCNLCGVTVSRHYLKKHQTTRKCKVNSENYEAPADEIFDDNESLEPERDVLPPADHQVSVPNVFEKTDCPVPGCPAHPPTKSKMRNHFRNIHSRHDRLIITEEGLLPLSLDYVTVMQMPRAISPETPLRSWKYTKRRRRTSTLRHALRNVVISLRSWSPPMVL